MKIEIGAFSFVLPNTFLFLLRQRSITNFLLITRPPVLIVNV